MRPRIVFMGTPDFALPALHAVCRLGTVVAAVTAPDKPAGRGLKLAESAVKREARTLSLRILQPRTLRSDDTVETLRGLEPDVIVVAAYGKILPPAVLDLAPHGCINVHASLLPRHRGAAPVQAAILAGDAESGVTIMLMDEGLDTGPILAQRAVPLDPAETGGSLTDRLAALGGELLSATLPRWLAGDIQPEPQDEARATMTRPLRKTDAALDWTRDAVQLERAVRAYSPWPGAYTTVAGAPLKVLAARVEAGHHGAPGELAALPGGEPVVAAATGGLVLERVQPAGRKPQSGGDWLRGHRHVPGTRLSG